MRRFLYFVYGVACYALFLGVYAYLAGFLSNVGVPKSIDSAPAGPIGLAVLVNLSLVTLFAVQHSVMARPAFKRVWRRVVPTPIERSTYVLASCVVTILLMWQWRTIDPVVWDLASPALRAVVWTVFAVGWLAVPAVSLLINHFDLFGARQVWLHLKRQDYTPLPFREPSLYKHVRHPLYLGWAVLFWATPTMTAGHALFAGALTAYMALAALVEERDLIAHFGADYADYRRRVPMFLPRLRRRSPAVPAAAE
ncbi:methanethiol S-methyltransferase [Botrimarina sp.]|uniref:methanethiol S-methyltransferase n=1 Tax=Botrimarina sp. TaxID=2795802 RepID=UPI0032EEA70A